MSPELSHGFKVVDDAAGHGLLQVEQAQILLSFNSEVLRLGGIWHGAGILGATNNRGDHFGGGLLTGKTGLGNGRAIIDDYNLISFCLGHSVGLFLFRIDFSNDNNKTLF